MATRRIAARYRVCSAPASRWCRTVPRQVRGDEYGDWDYIVGMDGENMRGLSRIFSSNAACRADGGAKLAKLLSFAGSSRDVADPWYTGDFDATYADVVNGCTALIEMLA